MITDKMSEVVSDKYYVKAMELLCDLIKCHHSIHIDSYDGNIKIMINDNNYLAEIPKDNLCDSAILDVFEGIKIFSYREALK